MQLLLKDLSSGYKSNSRFAYGLSLISLGAGIIRVKINSKRIIVYLLYCIL